MSDDSDVPVRPGQEFQQDTLFDKPGIVGARWWHKALIDRDRRLSRRDAMGELVKGGGILLGIWTMGSLFTSCVSSSDDDDGPPVSTALQDRESLPMQKTFGWDFGARGTPLVFDGQATGPFVRAELAKLPAVMAPNPGPFAKHHIPTLLESLQAAPSSTLPDPGDGRPRPDTGVFQKLADVILPISTPAMNQAYAAGAALARLAYGRNGLAVLADLPGPQAVAFAAGAASLFEPVLLLDNWPHPHGVVPSHLTLAALAYYQPRFASQKQRKGAPPLFVLDRARLAPYSDSSDRFDNRYFARMPKLSALAKDGINTLLYVVESPAQLPEPDDLHATLVVPKTEAAIELRALGLNDFKTDGTGKDPNLYYGGSGAAEDAFWAPVATPSPAPSPPPFVPSVVVSTQSYQFLPRRLPPAPPLGRVPVMVTATGIILCAALDRRGSMNRFSGGWSG